MLLNALSTAEKFSTGGTTAIVGILMTFIMLTLLIGCVFLMNYIIKKSKNVVLMNKIIKNFKVRIQKLKDNKVKKSEPSSEVTESISSDNIEEKEEKAKIVIDNDTLDAINSAVDMYMVQGENGISHNDYTIKHIKKI
ncbi:MAG: OadG family protein [Clostridia bacterium]